ncbi:AraC family transcriptional regulator [Pseudonocardia sp. WMMC193]|uniref:helix-turn-helix domain-containing protein n=1 Tax=Pseudonocardia sp. WMMC193 TaxID=2911965 RepID=UPI001F293067|nr:AraC family transcriptional regulator [Pseudonocardia sp. WMMC193]MCF7549698.1 AraC family transcriptional regulator [Pseudonocardia sp. WMMC193]
MSNPRHEPTVRGYAVTHPAGSATLPLEPGWHQFVYAAAGTMTVSTARGAWTLPPHRGLWIGEHEPVTVTNPASVAMRVLYLDAALRALDGAARAVNVPRFARELVLHAVRVAPLRTSDPVQSALVTLLVDQLAALQAAPLWLPLPTDPRARDLADAVRARPDADLDALARRVSTGRRTLERLFPAETGLTLGAWRRRARILRSVELLGAGAPVTRAAVEVGYTTPSAFVVAFRAELGETPGRYLGGV